MTLTLKASGRTIGRREAGSITRRAGMAAADAANHYAATGDHPGSRPAGRVLVTRTDIGSPNYRTEAREAAARGAVNGRSTATEPGGIGGGRYRVAGQDRAAVITTTRRDSFGHEAGTEPGPRHWHRDATGTRTPCPHERCDG